MNVYDVIIIGAGPGGLTAALYAARYNLNVLVFGKMPGGTATMAHKICNYPGFEEITGQELMIKMINQIKNLNVELKQEEVLDIKKGDLFRIKTNKENYKSKIIIIATGTNNGKLNIEKEDILIGKGISYCATCDARFYQDKTVGVVGGGNSALTAAILIAKFAKKVYIFYRKERFFRAEAQWIKEIEQNKKIIPVFNSVIEELIGEDKLKGIKINKDGKKENFNLDGLFIEIGNIPNIKLAESLGIGLENGFIKTNKEQKTNIKGVFAVGDVTNNPLKQIITACGEGAIAGFEAYKELRKKDDF